MPAVPATNDLVTNSKNRTVIVLLAATVGLLLFLLFAVSMVRFYGGTSAGPVAGTGIPVPPPPPGAPVDPPPPPPPPPHVGEQVIDESLRYPGAEELMNIQSAKGKGVLQLQTRDATSKVVEWYTAKLKPTNVVKLPFGNSILHSGDIGVVINGTESGTNILITRGEQ